MRTLSEIKSLYDSTLKQNLSVLEAQRKKITRLYLTMVAFLVVGIGGAYVYNISGIPTPGVLILVFFVLVCIGGLSRAYELKKQYREEYKSKVVVEIIKLINPDWRYEANNRIAERHYRMSGIFRTSYDKYEGDDFISGVIDKTDFQSSELHTQYKTTTTDKDGKTREQWHTIFKGMFFHADFNKEFSGVTYVIPEYSWKSFSRAAKELVKLENPEFEKKFAVYSADQIEARYIITPSIMEAMLAIQEHCGGLVYFSFVRSRVYCAMSFRKDLFEPKVYRSGVDFENVANMYQLFKVNELIIQELNLNTRIWTKT